jgi:hypothetical protein
VHTLHPLSSHNYMRVSARYNLSSMTHDKKVDVRYTSPFDDW